MEKKKTISIIDKEYVQWVKSLVERYRQSQIKAAVRVNAVKLKFNWQLGHEIVELKVEERWGEGVIEQLSKDLKKEMPHVEGFSVTNLGYCKRFYLLYSHYTGIYPQLGGKLDKITNFLIELGTGFAYVGKEYRLQIGDTEKFNKLESTSQPIGISEYELERFYPAKIEGTIPTIEEIESKLNNNPV